ncbi:MAG: NAD(P)H-dependent oxidoreductase [Oscillospiraceae bacterium]|nr:NAD(P)H-dependent oxidoreductase [Oscillospiraceae bacterium]
MKITVVNGTPFKGVTYHMKEMFLDQMRDGNEIVEFYPADMPAFCVGCKNCFFRGEQFCPHASKTMPVWEAMLESDLLVFAYPVYALRAPASIKSLLDHLCVHWMVHRPDARMFSKTAVILTNSVGAPNGAAQKDVTTSLSWMGVSSVYSCGAGMMGDILWDQISDKHVEMLKRKTARLYERVRDLKPRRHRKLRERAEFLLCKKMHQMVLKGEETPSLDNQHYIERGWIKSR